MSFAARFARPSRKRDVEFPVVIGSGFHPFPFRTRKLSLIPPMVLCGKLHGRVGRCRHYFSPTPAEGSTSAGVFFFQQADPSPPASEDPGGSMSFGSRIAVVTIWFALLVAAGGAWSYAQTPLPGPRSQPGAPAQPPTIISGADLGFRIDRMDGQ